MTPIFQVISELVVQRARSEFLAIAFENEERLHRELHKLLTAVVLFLKRNRNEFLQRMVRKGKNGRTRVSLRRIVVL